MEEAQLRESLARVDREELFDEIVHLYTSCAPARRELDAFLQNAPLQEQKRKELAFLFQGMGNYSTPLSCRQALLDYVKDCGSPKKEAKAFYAFAEASLQAREEGRLAEGILRPAASAFGKGLERLAKDVNLWLSMEEDTLRLAKRFYAYNEEEAWKAMRYYQEAKRAVQKKMDRQRLPSGRGGQHGEGMDGGNP